jgi:hypothetical protein
MLYEKHVRFLCSKRDAFLTRRIGPWLVAITIALTCSKRKGIT